MQHSSPLSIISQTSSSMGVSDKVQLPMRLNGVYFKMGSILAHRAHHWPVLTALQCIVLTGSNG